MSLDDRSRREIAHGKWLAEMGAEKYWGWSTPAGRIRAERRAQLIVDRVQLTMKSHVLEIGCGVGMFTEIFARTGAHVLALDLSADLLRIARGRRLPEERVRFVQGRLEDWSTDTLYDAVVGSSVLHHLDLHAALRKIAQILRPGGDLGFAEPNMLNPQVFIERRFRRFFPYVSEDETAFLRWQLCRLLEEAGFTDVHIEPFDWLHPATPRRLIPLVSKISYWLERLWLVRELAGSLIIHAKKPKV